MTIRDDGMKQAQKVRARIEKAKDSLDALEEKAVPEPLELTPANIPPAGFPDDPGEFGIKKPQ